MPRAQRPDRMVWRPPQTMAGLWRGTGVSLLMLAVGSGATALFSLRWGGVAWPRPAVVAITTTAVATGVKMTGGGWLSAVATVVLCLAVLLIGSAALADHARVQRGEQTEALVSAVRPATGRSSSSCLLRRLDDGREIRYSLAPCDGHRKGGAGCRPSSTRWAGWHRSRGSVRILSRRRRARWHWGRSAPWSS
ncbi:hypothetical protein ABZ826_38945 [Streptomyces sp. NPDC047515]|uniref:hypothetical protein n=1 Tax=Streptomyces sp. NPDC047515 TaxID=3155380 RepID=UPI00340D8BE0